MIERSSNSNLNARALCGDAVACGVVALRSQLGLAGAALTLPPACALPTLCFASLGRQLRVRGVRLGQALHGFFPILQLGHLPSFNCGIGPHDLPESHAAYGQRARPQQPWVGVVVLTIERCRRCGRSRRIDGCRRRCADRRWSRIRSR
jgi:hypothetical protein